MTHGTLFVIACPMLEDELIHCIMEDSENKRVVVLDGEHNGSLKRKMDANKVPYETMDEWDFMHDCNDLDRENSFNIVIRMMNLALHAEPQNLKKTLQEDLVMLQGHVDAGALYYGMCGNYGWDITAWAKEHLSFPVATFRDRQGRVCDDCVGVAVGGYDGYKRLIKEFTGVMLFTPEIATNWEDFINASDMMKGVGKGDGSGKAQIKEILDMCGYNSVVQIDTGYEPREEFDKATKEFADYMNFKILQASPDYADRWPANNLYEECKKMLKSSE